MATEIIQDFLIKKSQNKVYVKSADLVAQADHQVTYFYANQIL